MQKQEKSIDLWKYATLTFVLIMLASVIAIFVIKNNEVNQSNVNTLQNNSISNTSVNSNAQDANLKSLQTIEKNLREIKEDANRKEEARERKERLDEIYNRFHKNQEESIRSAGVEARREFDERIKRKLEELREQREKELQWQLSNNNIQVNQAPKKLKTNRPRNANTSSNSTGS